jgi:hypothetical protein
MPIVLTIQEAEIERIMVRSQPGQKIHKIPHLKQSKLGIVVHACHPGCMGSASRRIYAQDILSQK